MRITKPTKFIVEGESIEYLKQELLEAGKEYLAWKQSKLQLRSIDKLLNDIKLKTNS